MELKDLKFGVFEEAEPQIMEIIINEGVVLDEEKIQKIEEGLLGKYSGRYALLVNRKNRYSHTHESMMKVARLRNLIAIAILVYKDFAKQAAQIHELYQQNVNIFDDREKALTWLRDLL
jgi:hypothetical protein